MPESEVHDELHEPDCSQSPCCRYERLGCRCNRIAHDWEFDPPSGWWWVGSTIAALVLFGIIW